jgi:type II secretory pathway pseudopilin PulG
MRRAPARRTLRDQAGFALIEVVVSALIAVTVTGGVIKLVSATGKTGAEERHRSQAFAIAQEDQARLRSTQIADLSTALNPPPVTLNGTTYTITSTATFVNDETGGATGCGSGAKADYVQIGSKVTWPSMRVGNPVTIESIVSPVTGSLDPKHGNLSVTVVDGFGVPISGVGLNGTGPGVFAGSTDSNGCQLFGGQPEGDYTLTPSLSSEYVNVNGEAPSSKTVKITAGTTTPVQFLFGKSGTVNLGFTVRNSAGTIVPSSADAVTATASGMKPESKVFGAPGVIGPVGGTVNASPLFPFNYSYNFFAGSCSTNKPEAGQGTNVQAPANGTASGTIQLPALYLTVKNSSGTPAEQSGLSGAQVVLKDANCSVGSTPVKRSYTTNATGNLPDPGLPWSAYDICVSAKIGTKTKRLKSPGVVVHSLTGTSQTMTLSSSTPEEGTCP